MRTSTEIFAENLRNMLIARNKKQADLARFTGATSATVTYWCNGQAMPRATHCYKSTSDASKQLGLNEGSIRCVLGGSKRTLNGIRWIYLDQ